MCLADYNRIICAHKLIEIFIEFVYRFENMV